VSPSEHEYELILSKIRTLVEDGRGETIFEASFKLLSGLVTFFYCVKFYMCYFFCDFGNGLLEDELFSEFFCNVADP
jgi:hypothetical protein